MPGVYSITCSINNKIYVGSTTRTFDVRWREHLYRIKKRTHHNKFLLRAIIKYGIQNFAYEIIEECHPDHCLDMENYWINILGAADENHGYCLLPFSKTRRGWRHSDSAKEKCSIKNTGKKRTHEQNEANRIRNTGKIKSKDAIDKFSISMKKVWLEKRHIFDKRIEMAKKPVIKMSLSGDFIMEYDSLNSAANAHSLKRPSSIYNAINGVRKTAAGFKWKMKIIDPLTIKYS